MTLARAIDRLPPDKGTESTLRDVLVFFRKHKSEWIVERDVSIRTGYGALVLDTILTALRDAYVLDFADDPPRYRFGGSVSVEYEIEQFTRRMSVHSDHVQSNVAKFRERYGSF